jgi:hypothetical protein
MKGLLLLLVLASCAHAPPKDDDKNTPVAQSTEPGLKLDVQPGDAELIIDGQSLGPVTKIGPGGVVALKPGIYQVSLKARGYQTWRAEVTVGEKNELLKVALVKR